MVAGPNEQMGRGRETFALHDQLSTVGRVLMFKYIAAFLLLTAPVAWGQGKNDKEEVTTEDVKQFLDPTVMINSLDYTFTANFVPSSIQVYSHRISPFWAVNRWTGFWAEIPYQDFNVPDGADTSGFGDILLGWGAVTHENLESRFTTSAISFEALAPSGSLRKQTGSGTWVLAPGGALAFNPTDVFPVYVTGRYLHSVGTPEPERRNGEMPEKADEADLRVRSLELTINTVHILPKGFFVSAIPSLVFNFNQDFNLFSLGVAAGRALNKNFLISGGYVHHIAGRQSFNQACSVTLSFIFGERKDK